jgi:hypothetical protein
MGPLTETVDGNKFIIVFTDYMTKWSEAFPMPDQKAETVAEILVEEIIFRYGAPRKLLSDQGTNFTSETIKAVSKIFNIARIMTTAYHPQCDGMVERFNRTLIGQLQNFVNKRQNDWDKYIAPCTFAYRNTPHSATGYTPFYLMYLGHNNMPEDLEWTPVVSQYMDEEDYVTVMKERLQEAWHTTGLRIKFYQEQYKDYYDRKTKLHKIKVGDKVMVFFL